MSRLGLIVSLPINSLSWSLEDKKCGHPSVTRCLLAPIYQAAGHQRWVWPGGGGGLVWWGDVKRKWSSSARTLGGDLYWKYFSGIHMYYWLIMKVTFVKSVCCYSDGDLEMVHLRVTGECGAKELGQSCLLTRPWTLNRNIESEGEKQLEIIIQYPVRPRSGTSASKEIHNSLMILWRTDVLE